MDKVLKILLSKESLKELKSPQILKIWGMWRIPNLKVGTQQLRVK